MYNYNKFQQKEQLLEDAQLLPFDNSDDDCSVSDDQIPNTGIIISKEVRMETVKAVHIEPVILFLPAPWSRSETASTCPQKS